MHSLLYLVSLFLVTLVALDGPHGPGSPDVTGGGSLVRGPTCQGVLGLVLLAMAVLLAEVGK